MKNYLAIDIGASSGRAIVSYLEAGEQKLDEVYRFPNNVTECDGHLVWDIPSLFANIKEGIRHAFRKYGELESLSIDTWGVDFVCVAEDGSIVLSMNEGHAQDVDSVLALKFDNAFSSYDDVL